MIVAPVAAGAVLGVAALMVGVSLPGGAHACEPIGEPKPWYTDGVAQFVARVVRWLRDVRPRRDRP